jgi:hypothetical protein
VNDIIDILEEDCRTANSSPETTPEEVSNGAANALANGARERPLVTLVHRTFQVRNITATKTWSFFPKDFVHNHPFYLCRVF